MTVIRRVKIMRKTSINNRPQWYVLTYISLVIAMTYTVLPFIRWNLPQTVNQIIMISFSGLSLLGVILQKEWHKSNNLGALISVFILIIVVYLGKWRLIDAYNGTNIISRMCSLYEFWIFWVLSKNTRKFMDNDKKKLLRYYLFLISVTSITTIIGCLRYPEASRFLAGAANLNDTILYRDMNIGGYEFVYAITLLIPFLFYLIYKIKQKKIVIFMLAVLIYIVIIISQYAIALVFSIASIVVMLVLYFITSKKRQVFLIAIIAGLVLFFLSGKFLQLLYWIENVLIDLDLNTVARRIHFIINFVNGNGWGGSAGERISLRMQSFNVFLESPLYGCMFSPKALGEHSEILDTMGAGGLIGISVLAVSLISHHNLVKLFNKDTLFNIVFVIEFIMFIALGYLNTLFTSYDIALVFFVLPMLFIREDVNDKLI